MSSRLNWQLKLDIHVSSLGNPDNVGQFDSQARRLIEVINGKDLHPRRADHYFGLVHIRALKQDRDVNII